MFKKEYLNLRQSYEFDVKVFDQDNIFAGYLKLTPKKCTLSVMGERTPSNNFYNSKTIKCSTLDSHFFLYQLSISNMSSQLLQYKENGSIGFFEYEFEIGFVAYSNQISSNSNEITALEIESPLLKNWIGHTTTQRKLLDSMNKNKAIMNSTEFILRLENYGEMKLGYTTTSQWDSFSSSEKIHPKLKIIYDNSKNLDSINKEIIKLYTLLVFYIGYDFDLDSIRLFSKSNSNKSLSIYFPKNYSSQTLDYTLFPLEHNSRFHSELEPLPLDSFNKFFTLSPDDRSLYYRYLQYNRLKSNEEKFLGFFRLLEKITYQVSPYVDEKSLANILKLATPYLLKRLQGKSKDIKSFLKRIPQLNKSKYNTQSCLSKFYDELPLRLTEQIYLKKHNLQEICKLRNDITHANHFIITEENLLKFTLFIKVLLYIALLKKIGVDIQQHWLVVTRMESFYLLKSNKVITTKLE